MKQMILAQFIFTGLLFAFYTKLAEGDTKYRDLTDSEYAKFVSEAALENINVTPNNTQLQDLLKSGQSSLLTEALSDSSPPEMRQLGVLVLGASSPRRASYEGIIKFFSDPSEEVRTQAARVMRFMGHGHRMDELETTRLDIPGRALVELWENSSPKVRKEAITSFTRFARSSPNQFNKLLHIISSDPDMDVRKEAITQMGELAMKFAGPFSNSYSSEYKKLLKIGSTNPNMEIKEAIMNVFKELRQWQHPHNTLTPRFVKQIDKAIQKFDAQKASGNTNTKSNCRKGFLSRILGR